MQSCRVEIATFLFFFLEPQIPCALRVGYIHLVKCGAFGQSDGRTWTRTQVKWLKKSAGWAKKKFKTIFQFLGICLELATSVVCWSFS